MTLEEIVHVNLYFVEESAYRIVPDLYDYSATDWRMEDNVYFSSKELAKKYFKYKTKKIVNDNYVKIERYTKEYFGKIKTREFYAKWDNCYMKRLSIDSKQVKRDGLLMTNNTYYFVDKDNKACEIHDTRWPRKPQGLEYVDNNTK